MNVQTVDSEWVWSVAVDVVIFTLRNSDLQVYLVRRPEARFAGYWSLPGHADG